ncbi:hypothetical protein Tco_1079895 [Tanacetum coccineum]|uniref:Uncharacterized protein n=1 Tax=Tanacetum coccineum TaxID=301880 RepID=A0ABQ5HUP4_9ASTR
MVEVAVNVQIWEVDVKHEMVAMDFGPNAKLPILKLGEYEMWAIRIKQYFQIPDYAIWEVIENGDSWVSVSQTTKENGITVTKMSTHVTIEEKTRKKNDVKARGLLLMALLNEHQLTFSQYPDAKSMFAAIETRFGENYVQQIQIIEQKIKKTEWNNLVGVQKLRLHDLHQGSSSTKVLTTASSKLVLASLVLIRQSTSFALKCPVDNTVYAFQFMVAISKCSKCPTLRTLRQIHEEDLEQWECRAPRSKEGQFKNHDNTRKQGNNEDSSKAMLAIDGVGFD